MSDGPRAPTRGHEQPDSTHTCVCDLRVPADRPRADSSAGFGPSPPLAACYTAAMTRDELVRKLEALRDEAAGVDTDAAAVLACLVRVLGRGDDASELTAWCLEAERRLTERRERRGH